MRRCTAKDSIIGWRGMIFLSSEPAIIYSLDMHDEEFFTIRLPDDVRSAEYLSTYKTNLSQWNESVVLFCYPDHEWIKRKPIEIWAMNE
ncbi:hypothetical protein L484_003847 [Morus notabilis]|uniref:F-box associated domain-containing protein n=1 Tax=Morus notabilis TaxID=981085 RepID=W9QP97_9ROSA|nr:hypothetical protein L484_003847 [Morus notabilis]